MDQSHQNGPVGQDGVNVARQALYGKRDPYDGVATHVQGHDFNKGRDLDQIAATLIGTGLQATNLGLAIEEVNRMISWRLSDDPIDPARSDAFADPELRARTRTKIFLGMTSNMISSGMREVIRYLVQHRMVDVIVTTCGAVEEDIMKTMKPALIGDFALKGASLRDKGINRIGNMVVPNENYCIFEEWLEPLVEKCYEEQEKHGVNWTPSKLIDRMGAEINDESSVWYWCHKNRIPVFCPGITDGAVGDVLFFHTYGHTAATVDTLADVKAGLVGGADAGGKVGGLRLDIVEDVRRMNDQAIKASPRKTGILLLGGGLPKHHICNANMMRNGADFAVYLNTAQEFDGSDSGAAPDEAVSWGKIKAEAKAVKVVGDATITFPILVSQTFAKTWVPLDGK